MEKMTYVKALDIVLNGGEMTNEVIEKLTALRDATAKRNSGEKKLTKTQKENLGLMDAIYDGMEPNKSYTVTEISKTISAVEGLSAQRVNALVAKMKNAGRVVRTEEKRVAYFTKVE